MDLDLVQRIAHLSDRAVSLLQRGVAGLPIALLVVVDSLSEGLGGGTAMLLEGLQGSHGLGHVVLDLLQGLLTERALGEAHAIQLVECACHATCVLPGSRRAAAPLSGCPSTDRCRARRSASGCAHRSSCPEADRWSTPPSAVRGPRR